MTAGTGTLVAEAEALGPWLVEIRRRLHRRPEIGLELPDTQALIVEELPRSRPDAACRARRSAP